MLIRHIDRTQEQTVQMEGASGVRMAMMVGRQDGAPHFAMRSFRVDRGGHTPRHAHDYEHEVFIVEGAGEVLLEGAFHPVRAGDVIYVPADSEHQFRTESGMRFLCMVPVERNCGGATPGS